MEWNSKLPCWDFSDPDHKGELNIGAFEGPSFAVGCQPHGLDCSVDLNLGGLWADLCPPERWTNHPVMSAVATAALPAVPQRRGRGGGTTATCLVDGCKSDLSNSREYHRRHKVCEAHSKTPVVLVGGQEQRFCQQCSRFHHLVEFDEVKRSCRKRLDGHNRRRRKPQPESISSGSLFSDQGSRVLTFPHLTSAPGIIKTEGNPSTYHFPVYATERQQHLSSCFSSNKSMKQFPFLQQDNTGFSRTTVGQSTFQPFLKTTSTEERESGSCTQFFDLDCALSLLSSATNPGLNVGQMLPTGRIPMHHQSLVSSLPYCSIDRHSNSQASSYISTLGFPCPGVKDEQMPTVLVSEAAAGLDCQSMFNELGEGSSDDASQALPFSSWQ